MHLSRRTCLAMGLALGLSACFGSDTPFQTVEKFYAAVLQNNADQAIAYLALKQVSAEEMQLVKPKVQMMVAQARARAEANGGMAEIVLLGERILDNGQAEVMVKERFKNGKSADEDFRLIQEDGHWKIRL